MKTTINRITPVSIDEFADKHSLEMVVSERSHEMPKSMRFYAHFKNCEEKTGQGMLRGTFGNGATPTQAIKAYAQEISGKTLVVDAFTEKRREILVPNRLIL